MRWETYDAKAVHRTTDGVAKTGPGFLHRIIISGTATGAITIYDNTAASGTVITTVQCPANDTTPIEIGVPFVTGIYVDLAASTGVTVIFS